MIPKKPFYYDFYAQNIQWVTESVRKVRDHDRLTP